MAHERTYVDPKVALRTAALIVQAHLVTLPGAKRYSVEALAEILGGGEDAGRDDFSVEWERGWGVSATLYVSTHMEESFEEERRVVWLAHLKVAVSTSGTQRSVAEAVAHADLLTRVAALACAVEAGAGRDPIARVRWKRCDTCATIDHPPGEPCATRAVLEADLSRAEKAVKEAEGAIAVADKAVKTARKVGAVNLDDVRARARLAQHDLMDAVATRDLALKALKHVFVFDGTEACETCGQSSGGSRHVAPEGVA